MGCGISYAIYARIRSRLLRAPSPLAAVRAAIPTYYAVTAAAMTLFLGLIGPRAYRLTLPQAVVTAGVVYAGVWAALRNPSQAMLAAARATAVPAPPAGSQSPRTELDDAPAPTIADEAGGEAGHRLHGRRRDGGESSGGSSPAAGAAQAGPAAAGPPAAPGSGRGASASADGTLGLLGAAFGRMAGREAKVDGGKDTGSEVVTTPDGGRAGADEAADDAGPGANGAADDAGSEDGAESSAAEAEFVRLMVLTSCVLSFSHGSQDVSNAAAPYAAIVAVAGSRQLTAASATPAWVLAAGGAGIVVGLATYGYKVMATVGTGITKLTFSKGFAAQLATALTALSATLLGLTVSTTHVMIGAIAGVALADDPAKLNTAMLRKIAASWVITLPASAGLAAVAFFALSATGIPAPPPA